MRRSIELYLMYLGTKELEISLERITSDLLNLVETITDPEGGFGHTNCYVERQKFGPLLEEYLLARKTAKNCRIQTNMYDKKVRVARKRVERYDSQFT